MRRRLLRYILVLTRVKQCPGTSRPSGHSRRMYHDYLG